MLRAFSGASLASRLGGRTPIASSRAANSNDNNIQSRSFMSPAFACREAWEARLDSHVFRKLEMGQFFYEVEKKFARENRGSAIDVDLFAQAARGETQMDQLEELLHQFRRTPQTVTTLASTPHAVVRTLLAEDRSDNLMRILDDPLNYGLFPDDYCLVYMMDHYLEAENWRDACKVAVHMMLQENLSVPVAAEMAALACYKYAVTGEPKPWEPQAPERYVTACTCNLLSNLLY